MRKAFAGALHAEMERDGRIVMLTGDLGYGVLDRIRDDYTNRFWNMGAAEQLAVGAGIGLALDGKIPFVYSITPFLLCRPFEWLRNYLQHEGVPVRLVGVGMDDDYKHFGISHEAFDARAVLGLFPRIRTHFPQDAAELPGIVSSMCSYCAPAFLSLRR